MTDKARKPEDPQPADSARPDRDPFSLEAYLERQHAEFANGPTMDEILADVDRFRSGGVPRDIIAATIREDRDA